MPAEKKKHLPSMPVTMETCQKKQRSLLHGTADQIEIQRFFCYIWDMKQKIAIQQTLTHRSLFHPEMEDGLKILSCGIHDLRSFLQETSVSAGDQRP